MNPGTWKTTCAKDVFFIDPLDERAMALLFAAQFWVLDEYWVNISRYSETENLDKPKAEGIYYGKSKGNHVQCHAG